VDSPGAEAAVNGGEHDAEVPVARVGDVALAAGQQVVAAGQRAARVVSAAASRARLGWLGDGEPAIRLARQQQGAGTAASARRCPQRNSSGRPGSGCCRCADGASSAASPFPKSSASAVRQPVPPSAPGIAPRTQTRAKAPPGRDLERQRPLRSAAGSAAGESRRLPRAPQGQVGAALIEVGPGGGGAA